MIASSVDLRVWDYRADPFDARLVQLVERLSDLFLRATSLPRRLHSESLLLVMKNAGLHQQARAFYHRLFEEGQVDRVEGALFCTIAAHTKFVSSGEGRCTGVMEHADKLLMDVLSRSPDAVTPAMFWAVQLGYSREENLPINRMMELVNVQEEHGKDIAPATYNLLLYSARADLSTLPKVMELMGKHGVSLEPRHYKELVWAYAHAGRMDKLDEIIDRLDLFHTEKKLDWEESQVAHEILKAHRKAGDIDKVREVYNLTKNRLSPDYTTFTETFFSALCDHGLHDEVAEVFDDQSAPINPKVLDDLVIHFLNKDMLDMALKAFTSLRLRKVGNFVHRDETLSALIVECCERRLFDVVEGLVNTISNPKKASRVLSRSLSAMFHSKPIRVYSADKLFYSMDSLLGVEPTTVHYTTMCNIYMKSRRMDKLASLLNHFAQSGLTPDQQLMKLLKRLKKVFTTNDPLQRAVQGVMEKAK